MAETTPYVYILVRKDMPLEDQVVQSNHASLEAGFSFGKPADHPHIVLLEVDDQDELLSWANFLKYNSIDFRMFFEPDDQLEYTALTTEPLYGKSREHFKSLNCWKYK
jgi:hypothetical protein